MSKSYRIVTDVHEGFELQYRTPWWPFWRQCLGRTCAVNTHATIEDAEAFARWDARRSLPPRCVRVLGVIRA